MRPVTEDDLDRGIFYLMPLTPFRKRNSRLICELARQYACWKLYEAGRAQDWHTVANAIRQSKPPDPNKYILEGFTFWYSPFSSTVDILRMWIAEGFEWLASLFWRH